MKQKKRHTKATNNSLSWRTPFFPPYAPFLDATYAAEERCSRGGSCIGIDRKVGMRAAWAAHPLSLSLVRIRTRRLRLHLRIHVNIPSDILIAVIVLITPQRHTNISHLKQIPPTTNAWRAALFPQPSSLTLPMYWRARGQITQSSMPRRRPR